MEWAARDSHMSVPISKVSVGRDFSGPPLREEPQDVHRANPAVTWKPQPGSNNEEVMGHVVCSMVRASNP